MPVAEQPVRAPVERPTTVYLNDESWMTVQTTPIDLRDWAYGYLFGEGLISSIADVERVVSDEDHGMVWVDLKHSVPAVKRADRPQLGEEPHAFVSHDLSITTDQCLQWMKQMLQSAVLYSETGGMHVAAAVRVDTGEMVTREDIGRHNAVDKVIGASLRAGWPSDQLVILTSGRISYEMANRLARLGVGIGISRTAATDQAYHLACRLGIELVGYARGDQSLTIYTVGKRVRRGI